MQPPFQNNVLNEEEEVEELEYEDLDQNINHLEEESYESFLTKYQYQNSKFFYDIYTSPADNYETDSKNSYNIRSSARQVAQIPKNKVVAPTKQWPDPSLEKKQNHMLNKSKVTECEETNRTNQDFNFENELSKVKIPVPLTELMKIPSIRDHAYRMLKS